MYGENLTQSKIWNLDERKMDWKKPIVLIFFHFWIDNIRGYFQILSFYNHLI
jgi:hypothetical protein